MKKLVLSVMCGVVAVTVHGQGTIDFKNVSSNPVLNAPLYDGAVGGTLLSAGLAQLWVLNPSSTLFEAIGAAVAVNSGYFVGNVRTISFVPAGNNATIQIRAWTSASGATWDAAAVNPAGKVNFRELTLATGGGGSPAGPPAIMTAMTSFAVVPVPEPSVIALGVLGALALLFRRRK